MSLSKEEDVLRKLAGAVTTYEVEQAEELAKNALAAGIDPVKAIEDGLAEG
ncbi:MAG: B12-binding domain-containing protein, partial [Candidatus Bathyarchaeia archaeon]